MLTLGQAVSELVRQAADRPLVTEDRSGLRVLRLNRRSPKVTTELVDRLREDVLLKSFLAIGHIARTPALEKLSH